MINLPKHLSVNFPKILDPTKRPSYPPIAAKDGEFYQSKTPPVCIICQDVTFKVCSKCFAASYCSPKCWEKDNKRHLKECGKECLLVLKTNEDDGIPHYVFQGRIPAASHILQDDVPVILPTLPDGYVKNMDIVDKPLYTLLQVCYGCHKHFCVGERRHACPRCGIAYCGEECAAPYHSYEECLVINRVLGHAHKFSDSLTNPRKYVERYLDICVLRVLSTFLRAETNAYIADRFRKFQLLSSLPRFKVFNKTKRDNYDDIQYLKLLKTVDRLTISLAFSKQSREVLQHAYRSMVAFWEPFDQVPGVVSRLLFLDRNFMTQSYCSPNVAVSVSFDNKRIKPTWFLYTLREIKIDKCGGQVPVRFDFSPSPIMPIALRMDYLKENGLSYECHKLSTCTRCNDATDSGTDSASIVCMACSIGLYVEGSVRGKNLLFSEFPKRWSSEYVDTVDWICNECEDAVPYSFILEMNREFMKIYLENVATRFSANVLADIVTYVDNYKYILHPFNGVILRAKFDFVMAAREKHLRECGYNSVGFPLDPNRGEKELMGIPLDRLYKMRAFPVHWNLKEMNFTYVRSRYLEDCMKYFEACRRTSLIPMEHSVIFTFCRLEHNLIKLVMLAFYYCMDPRNAEDNEEFIAFGNFTGKMIQDFQRKCVVIFGAKLIATDPYLKSASREMRFFGNIIDRNKDTEILAKLVIQGLGLKTKSEFTLMSPEELDEIVREDSKEEYNKCKVLNVIMPNDSMDMDVDDDELISA